MSLRGKKLAILGGTRISCEIVRAARTLGVLTAVLDYYPPEKSPAKRIADEHALISVADAEAVAGYVRKNGVDGLITGYTDSILGMYADACEASGLPCYGTRAQFETFSDKARWKRLCREFGVPTARAYPVDELLYGGSRAELPLLVKPADGSGSRGVSVVREAEDLPGAVERALSFSKEGEIVVEDYLEGPEITAFWLFTDGRREVFMVGDRVVKGVEGSPVPLPVGYAFPSAFSEAYLHDVAPRVESMLASQGVRNGMMFMQCVVRDGVPFVYDIGYRLTGSLEHHLTAAIAGYSPMDMLIRFALTGKMSDDGDVWEKVAEGRKRPCFNVSVLMRPGTIDRFEGLDEVEASPGVAACVKAHVEGETLPPEAAGELRQIALRILGVPMRGESVEEAMIRVRDGVRIVSAEGGDIALPGLRTGDLERLRRGGFAR